MQETKKKALALSKYFVSLPHPAKTVIAIFALSFLLGVLFSMAKGEAFGALSAIAGGLDGTYLLAFPAVLSAIGLFILRRKAIFRRASFLALLTVACYGAFYLAALLLEDMMPSAANLVFVGFGASFALWYFMLIIAFDFRRSAPLFAFMQLVLFAFFFLTSAGFGGGADPAGVLLRVFLASLVFICGFYLLFYIISAPMKKNLGVSSMDALSMFLSQWLYGERDLEEVFDEIGEDAETMVWLARFSGRKHDTLFVVPYMHFGPFGNLGGSEFTHMISASLSQGGKRNVFVFHGTATHDFNPVTSSEIVKVLSACNRALARLRLSPARLSHNVCRVGSVRASALRIGGSAFLSYTRAPLTTEDINFGLGLALLEKAKKYVKGACVVDEHNAETGDISSVEVGSPIGFEMLDATEKLLSSPCKQAPFLFASAQEKLPIATLGSNGLKLALFAQGKRLTALLLADSNSVTPEFRDSLLSLMSSLGREHGYSCNPEVMSTDTHQINTVQGVFHPLGEDDKGAVFSAVRKLFSTALEHLEPVKFGAAQERFRLRVFGTGQSAEIASTINAVVALLKLALPLMLVGGILLIIWGFGKIS
jgi:putative membrane protein